METNYDFELDRNNEIIINLEELEVVENDSK